MKPYQQYIPARLLTVDHRVQRDVIQARVRELVRELESTARDLNALGVVTVSKRRDGTFHIVDGQHRVLALLEIGFGDWEADCRVYENLTLPDEAALFRTLNNTRRPTAFDDYKVGLEQGDPECIAIERIARRAGLRVVLQSNDGCIACIGTLRKLYRSSQNGRGPAALGFALSIATSAWGTQSEAVDGHIIGGLGALYLRYGEELDRAALTRKLAKHKGGPLGLIGQAKGLREHRPMTIARCVAIIALDVYNRGRRERLPAL